MLFRSARRRNSNLLSVQILAVKETIARNLHGHFTKLGLDVDYFAECLTLDVERMQDTLLDEIKYRGPRPLDILEDRLSE